MPYLPNIPDYKPFYLQMEGETTASDTAAKWGMIAKSNPYPVFPGPKPRYSVDWKDEDGVAEYIGTGQKLQPLEFSFDFIILSRDLRSLTAARQVRQQFGRFVDRVRGGYFSTYDAYTGIGLNKVRYVGFTQADYWQGGARLGYIFSVQFICDAPTQRMAFSSGAIVPYSASTYPSPFVPSIADYKPFYVQGTSGVAKDTATEWGAVARLEQPPVMPNAKPAFREDTPQEDGGIGFAPAHFQPIDFSVGFYMKAYANGGLSAEDILLTQMLSLRTFLAGNPLMVLDSWTDFGKRGVQYMGGSVEDFATGDDWARVIFSLSFRANDPITAVTYQDGSLVPETIVGLDDNVGTHLYSNEPYRLQAETNE